LIRLSDILTPRQIRVPLSAETKPGIIEELVDILDRDGKLADRDATLRAVLERESLRTTGIGNALAIPHGRTDAVREVAIAIGKTARPVDFESIDGQPIALAILLVSPADQIGLHIQTLARISRLVNLDGFRRALAAASTPEEAFEIIRAKEQEAMQ